MKKVFALFVIAGMVAFVACGPNKDAEKAKKLKDSLTADSIMKDSILQAEIAMKTADSLKQIAVKDSLKKDSIEKAKKGGKKEVKK